MPKIIEVKNVSKYFRDAKVIDELSFNVEDGEIFGIVGPDGSGKTTTVRLVSGIMDVSSGNISVSGYDTKKEIEKIRNIIGYMPQRLSLYEDLSVEENINFFADLYSIPKKDKVARRQQLYKFSRLENFKDRLAQHLSGGMQKKLALSCALINFPKILILDEPTIGVDPVSREELWNMLEELNRKDGITILVTTNYMDEVTRFDRVGLIYKGRFLVCDKPDNIIGKEQSFENVFISKIEQMKND
jgi:ABC-2 type transport system ATP-binding protein